MQQPIDFLKTLEGLNYLSTMGLLVVAIIGLKQLRISKQLSRVAARRDAFRLANEQVKYFLESIIPLINDLNRLINDKNVTFFKVSTFEMEEGAVKVKLTQGNKAAMSELVQIVDPLLGTLNALEAFSTYFTSKIADERIAFQAVGKTYCRSVTTYMPALILLGEGEHYKNIVELYRIWQERFDQQVLSNEKDKIEKKLEKIKDQNIVPIGTSDDN
jgi:hypothetical protein